MANPIIARTARAFHKAFITHKTPLWSVLSTYMLKPSRARRNINIKQINQLTKTNDTVVFPGKVLGTGNIQHSITLYSFSISASALAKIKAAGGTIISHDTLVESNPTGKGVVLLG